MTPRSPRRVRDATLLIVDATVRFRVPQGNASYGLALRLKNEAAFASAQNSIIVPSSGRTPNHSEARGGTILL